MPCPIAQVTELLTLTFDNGFFCDDAHSHSFSPSPNMSPSPLRHISRYI